jgi:hypothetical protein
MIDNSILFNFLDCVYRVYNFFVDKDRLKNIYKIFEKNFMNLLLRITEIYYENLYSIFFPFLYTTSILSTRQLN